MITYAKKIKPITTNKPKMTLKKVFQNEPSKNKRSNNKQSKVKNKKKNKSKY